MPEKSLVTTFKADVYYVFDYCSILNKDILNNDDELNKFINKEVLNFNKELILFINNLREKSKKVE